MIGQEMIEREECGCITDLSCMTTIHACDECKANYREDWEDMRRAQRRDAEMEQQVTKYQIEWFNPTTNNYAVYTTKGDKPFLFNTNEDAEAFVEHLCWIWNEVLEDWRVVTVTTSTN